MHAESYINKEHSSETSKLKCTVFLSVNMPNIIKHHLSDNSLPACIHEVKTIMI